MFLPIFIREFVYMNNLTAIIPFFNGHQYLARLINSLPYTLNIIIVDDKSDLPLTQEQVDKICLPTASRQIRVLQMVKKGYFSGAIDRGIRECNTDVLILNQDIWFENSKWVEVIETHKDKYAFIGERIKGNHPSFGELGYAHGTFLYLKRDLINKIGLFDVEGYSLWGSTALYQWRAARAGFDILPLKEIPGFHHERKNGERYGSSIQQILEIFPEKKDLLIRTPPLLSVIVPNYNYGRYLSDCINSLIGGMTSLGSMEPQSFCSFEIIIVDDASTDNSKKYIEEVADIKKGIRAYYLDKNGGTAKTLNYGIERAVGKYITFLSADDMREPDSLEKLVRVCEANPRSFAYDDVWIVNNGKRIKKWHFQEYDFEELIWKNHIHAGIMFPREAWVETGGYPAIMGDGREDWAFNIALGVKGWCGIHVSNFGYLYRREGQNRTETNTTEPHREKFLSKIMDLFPDLYRGYRPMACCGKGGNTKKSAGKSASILTNGAFGENMMIGRNGMEKIEYIGEQMNFTISGDKTNAKYSFGKDRPRGWVAREDVGERSVPNSGFLSKKDKMTGKWLYRLVKEEKKVEQVMEQPTQQPIQQSTELSVENTPEIISIAEQDPFYTHGTGAAGMSEASGTLTAAAVKIDFPDPKEVNVAEIKEWKLSREQWEEVYRAEMKGLNRKGATAFIEELLANWPKE